ncbi:MAG: imidazole glycerol phosphate synthase subunit HisH [Deltaproteobacteria bacterium CG_4_8_14_3_um_filter_51_11]|nr:imidazole glycerol phosphate synthase subunit HisH [Deltaproteobacteria bacterium]NCP08830.1 imidazole glycerol phosphate synthase subunit HisH [bacterium]OIP39195.1 MAG: imidazole glycerol phosphate synthase subunit HisH [Desulfobacteraceae bacterium CG2_30_51_40]PIP47035.1 MAG: imidazole glycerol phosphate synthase subunit HisH [Deltaproteobacteria bacterium CG23_combo_of_CG06-09_8_20_14_all_51_20]PIX18549.1 MAG: imidazole glycerol phosphate synthase subunit HisH [Deltaproteobacteria bacte
MIAIVDYKAGNLTSVERAVRYLGYDCRITGIPVDVSLADRIIFPGVGAAGKAVKDLKELGLDQVLKEQFEQGKPILGICLGAQIILERSEEDEAFCLGLIPGVAKRFPPDLSNPALEKIKIPHMGWNSLHILQPHPVLRDTGTEDEFYFVHSYYPSPAGPEHIIATSRHGIEFPAVLGSSNLVAVQFHPEKSGRPGLKLLDNFCRWDGR